MAVNFTDSPSNGDTVTANGETYTFNSSTGVWDVNHRGPTTLLGLTDVGSDGSNGQLLTTNGSGSFSFTSSTGITSHNIGGLGSNRFYAGLISVNGGTTRTLSTTTLDYLPFQVFEDCVIDGLNIIIDGGTGTSGDLAQIAIYGPVSQDLTTAARKVVSSSFAVDSGYGKTVSITATSFTAGVYLYCITANTASLDIRSYEQQGKYVNYMVGCNNASFPGGLSSHQYGQNTVTTFPHSYPTSVNASQVNPSIYAYQFRYQVQ